MSKLPIGKFGIGAKAPLSTGVEFYTMESRYNGQLFRFNIYLHSLDSIIPAKNLETGEENPYILFNEGTEEEYKVYYERTTMKNGVLITLEAKKHHKVQFIDSVKSQMLYFPNITLYEEDKIGTSTPVDYKAKILYEDEYIVMSEQDFYSKPHLLINGVNYGYIDWREMELEDRLGNVGIKVAPEDVEVSQSRESVIWSDLTKEKVLKRFTDVLVIAQKMIEKELESTDLIRWLKACYAISGKYSNRNGVLGRLASIVDMAKVKLRFNGDNEVIFTYMDPLEGLIVKEVEVKREIVNHVEQGRKVSREEVSMLGARLDKPIFLKQDGEPYGNRKDKYLASLYPNGFLVVHEPFFTMEGLDAKKKDREMSDTEYSEYKAKLAKGALNSKVKMWDLLQKAEGVTWYEDVEVPEDFNANDDVEEKSAAKEATKEEKEKVEIAKQSAAQRRKEQGKTIIHQLVASNTAKTEINSIPYRSIFEFGKDEVPLADIDRWDAEEIYYGFDSDADLLGFTALFTRDPHPDCNPINGFFRGHAYKVYNDRKEMDALKWMSMKWWRKNHDRTAAAGLNEYKAYARQWFYDTPVMLFKVARTAARYYRQFAHVQEFYMTIINNKITMSNTLIKWNTARLILGKLTPCNFLYNFEIFNKEYFDKYTILVNYVNKHYRIVEGYNQDAGYKFDKQTYIDIITHLDNVRLFQDLVKDNTDKREISRVAKELFGNAELKDGMAVEPEMMQMMQDCLDYANAVGPMLNLLPVLTGINMPQQIAFQVGMGRSKQPISEEAELEIKQYLEIKGVTKYQAIEDPAPSGEEELMYHGPEDFPEAQKSTTF